MSDAAPIPSALPRAHPLWPLIAAAPTLPFSIFPTRENHPFEERVLAEVLIAAGVLHMALVGDSGPFDDIGHTVNFCAGTEPGLLLSQSASIARRAGPAVWQSFRASLWLDGFPDAFSAWLPLVASTDQEADIKAKIRDVHDWETRDPATAEYLFAQLHQGGSLADFKALAEAYAKEEKAAAARGKPRAPKGGETLAAIRQKWISHALWCLDSHEIQFLLWGPGTRDHSKTIANKISELGLAETRRPEHGPTIDRARVAAGFPEI